MATGCAIAPQPYSQQEFLDQARRERDGLFGEQEPLASKVSLHEAMARAIKYNLDHRVKQMEKALASGMLEQSRYDLLPQLVASAGYSARSNDNGSASKSLLSGQQSLEPSTSEEQSRFNADIIHVWNILDFGVSYNQALQQADQVLVAEEWRRKAVQNIVQDVRHAYWRAANAELLLPRMDQLLTRVESALSKAREMEKKRVQEPVKSLEYQQQLLETVKQLWVMRRELSLAKTELAALMNLKPGTDYRIGLSQGELQYLEQLLAIDALEEEALVHRPELRVEAYQKRISTLEIKKALLGMMPGLEISLGASYDDNKYLYNNSWLHAGLNLSWNAFNLLSGPARMHNAELQAELAKKRYMATAMMVMTQVHLSHQRYALALKEYQIAEELDAVHQRRLVHAEAARKAQTGNELEEIRNLAAALSARMNRGVAYAELQGALGRVFHSTGIDPLPAVMDSDDVKTLAQVMQEHEGTVLAALRGEGAETAKVTVEVMDEQDFAKWLPAPAAAKTSGLAEQAKKDEATVAAENMGQSEQALAAAPDKAASDSAITESRAAVPPQPAATKPLLAPAVKAEAQSAEPAVFPDKKIKATAKNIAASEPLFPERIIADGQQDASQEMGSGEEELPAEEEPFRVRLKSAGNVIGSPRLLFASPGQGIAYRVSEEPAAEEATAETEARE